MASDIVKSKRNALAIMTAAYLLMLVCYGFMFTSDDGQLISYLVGITIMFSVIAWVCAYTDYRIEKLRQELSQK